MIGTRYVECCDRMVPAWAAIFYYFSDKPPVYLCRLGEGCTKEEA